MGCFFLQKQLNIGMEKGRDNGNEPAPVQVPVEDVLDLHCFQPKEVPGLLGEYLHACRHAGIYSVRIIHGKGRGVLRDRVHSIVKKSPLVVTFSEAPLSSGGWGATLVELKERGRFEKDFITALDEGALVMGATLDHTQMGLMALHAGELLAWNRTANLTAITEPREMAEKLFLESLPVSEYVPVAARLLDIGSGGGFPGIPLKLIRPDMDVTLLDGKRKKINFLKYVVRILGLKGVEARQGRAEQFAPKAVGSKALFGVVISKAVGDLDKLLRLSLPLVGPDGVVIAMKGAAMENEIALARATIEREGLQVRKTSYRLPFSGIMRGLVVLERTGKK